MTAVKLTDDGPFQATDAKELERQIMNCNVPKNEREHWAAREIEKLRNAAEASSELHKGLSDYYWDLVRTAEGMPAKMDPFDLAKNAEILLRKHARFGNGYSADGWVVGDLDTLPAAPAAARVEEET